MRWGGPHKRVQAVQRSALNFLDRECAGFAHFHAAFAAKAFVFVHRFGFAVDQFEYINRANIDAFSVAVAFVLIYRHLEHLLFLQNCGRNPSRAKKSQVPQLSYRRKIPWPGPFAWSNIDGNSMNEYSTDGCREFLRLRPRPRIYRGPIHPDKHGRAKQLPKQASWHDSVLSQSQATPVSSTQEGTIPIDGSKLEWPPLKPIFNKLQREANPYC